MKFQDKRSEFAAIFVLILGILILWIYKFPFLNLTYFWDEGWSYATAIYRMSQGNPCLLPACLHPDLSRGHPLVFYFINAVVAKIFGFSPQVMHVFALLVASIFLVLYFFILRLFTNPVFALLGTLLLLSQEVFIVQSSFMLPEIIVSMLMMVMIIGLFTRRILLYIISASLLVLTKESGMVMVFALCTAAFVSQIKEQLRGGGDDGLMKGIKYYLNLSLPLLIGIAFYVIQKKTYGWYFYPAHIQLTNFDWNIIGNHFLLVREFIFCGYGRLNLSVLLGIMLFLFLISRLKGGKSFNYPILRISWIMLVVFAFYSFFSVVNYVSLRYLIPLLVIFIFLLVIWSYQLYQWGFRFLPYLFCLSIGIALYHDYTSDPTWIDDVSINYKDNLAVFQQAVGFMEDEKAQSKMIYTNYTIESDLKHPELGSLHGPPFTNVRNGTLISGADYYIFSNFILIEAYYESVRKNNSLELLKRFQKGQAWCEVYGKK